MSLPKAPEGWLRCPSVTTGGQPFFYVNHQLKLCVVWNRSLRSWRIRCLITNKDSEGYNKRYHRGPIGAIRHAEKVRRERNKPKVQPVVFRAERKKSAEITAVLVGQQGSLTAPLAIWDPSCGHGSGSYGWYRHTRPAQPEEYAEALEKLRSIYAPEYVIEVRRRLSYR